MSTPEYRKFVQKMLERAKINSEYRELFTDAEGMKLFTKVITHPTRDPANNYQELEFVGDGIIKGILGQYIPRRFPNLARGESKYSKKGTGEGVLSKTRRFLEQRKTLSDFGLELGFWDYVQADEEVMAQKRKETLEDVFEAFVGALVEIVDQRTKQGLGYYYAYRFVAASLDNLKIDIKKETLDDPITRLNELYKANEIKGRATPLKWGDAIYKQEKFFLPRVQELPKTADIGEIVFLQPIKGAYVFTPKGWMHITRSLPQMEIKATPLVGETEEETKELNQLMWYAGVYGFPKATGPVILTKADKLQLIENPGYYGAELIGQGLSFKLKDSKKNAATQALDWIKRNVLG